MSVAIKVAESAHPFRLNLLRVFVASLSLLSVTSGAQDSNVSVSFEDRPGIADNVTVTATTLINQDNLADHKKWLNPHVAEMVEKGWLTLPLGPYQTFASHPNYVSASANNAKSVQLGNANGDLENYVAGRPFPAPLSADDPRAGEKAIWNMRYGYAPDETETRSMLWEYKSMDKGTAERTLSMYGAILRFKHRHMREPFPELARNPSDLFSALYLKVQDPADIRNTQLLIHTQADDAEPEQAWIYLSTQRRVRRLATGQKTNSFLGSDIMIEDFLGYNGRIRDMQWQLLEQTEAMLPMYAFDQLPANSITKAARGDYPAISFSGKGNCFPNVTWQPRSVLRLQATPVDPSHPISKRIFTLDAETFAPVLAEIYDRGGKLWKLGIIAVSHSSSHNDAPDWQGAMTDGVSMIDVQAEHCTTIQFSSQIAEQGLRPLMFTTQEMRSAGR